jgi:transposase InsO family protein
VVGWALDRSLAAQLAVDALNRAIADRTPSPGLVHHSDRGVQYASAEYGKVLDKHRIIASMSRLANPWDNAKCESFMKTLKQEEIRTNDYRAVEPPAQERYRVHRRLLQWQTTPFGVRL